MKIKAHSFLFILFLFTISGIAQVAPDKYFVRFTDKNNSPYSIDNPSEFLTQRSIQRRLNQGIAIDMTDIPVNTSYLQGVAGTGALILNPTKWFNGVTIFTDDQSVLDEIAALPYVYSITKSPKTLPPGNELRTDFEKPFFKNEIYNRAIGPVVKQGRDIGSFNYGLSLNQIQMLNGDALHEMGYRGQGMVIAVLDAGFLNANTLTVFDSLWDHNQVLGTHDFVRGGPIQFDEHPHGAMTLSCMAGNSPGQLIGTAPKAFYYLLRSEDGETENIIEEYNWVSAAEYADSVGADVISSSLGYTQFDDPSKDHTYADMNGNTTPATRGADMACKKGIQVVNSLGNDGSDSWYYLSAPSDGDSVLGIGAVDANGNYASFSSHGPSYDGRVKPDVVAQGENAYVVDPYSGEFTFGSGTSFSCPIMAGMVACLWQANPSLNNKQIADAIRRSASQYTAPDAELGYGIPDFILADLILSVPDRPDAGSASLDIYPNPFRNEFTIDAGKQGSAGVGKFEGVVEISDVTGRLIGTQNVNLVNSGKMTIDLLQNAPKGLYFVKVNFNGSQSILKVVKE